MAGDVKGTDQKPRQSRGGRARATRQRIVAAATDRFVARGYIATTLADVAADAGVAVQTVYFHFANKPTLLGAAVDMAAAGDDEAVPVLARPWMEALAAEPDPRRVVALWVANGREIFVRVAPIMGVVREAAATDADMAEQWATNESQRLTAFGVLAEQLDRRGALPPDTTVEEATDIVFALNSPEVYLLLTGVRGWTTDAWARWLEHTLVATLVQDEGSDPADRI